ncbi:MAG: hypothetical protein ACYCZR_06110 [Burkholderiales bacterium]
MNYAQFIKPEIIAKLPPFEAITQERGELFVTFPSGYKVPLVEITEVTQ